MRHHCCTLILFRSWHLNTSILINLLKVVTPAPSPVVPSATWTAFKPKHTKCERPGGPSAVAAAGKRSRSRWHEVAPVSREEKMFGRNSSPVKSGEHSFCTGRTLESSYAKCYLDMVTDTYFPHLSNSWNNSLVYLRQHVLIFHIDLFENEVSPYLAMVQHYLIE